MHRQLPIVPGMTSSSAKRRIHVESVAPWEPVAFGSPVLTLGAYSATISGHPRLPGRGHSGSSLADDLPRAFEVADRIIGRHAELTDREGELLCRRKEEDVFLLCIECARL